MVCRQAINLNQFWHIVKWTPKNKLQRNSKLNWNIFIEKNAFQNVCRTMVILSRPQCVHGQANPWTNVDLSRASIHEAMTSYQQFLMS